MTERDCIQGAHSMHASVTLFLKIQNIKKKKSTYIITWNLTA